MPKPLSPAAQAVYEAAIEQSEYPNDAEWVVINALRAAADQIDWDWEPCSQLLAIAAELEGQ